MMGNAFAVIISEKEGMELIELLNKAFNDPSIHDPEGRKERSRLDKQYITQNGI